MTGTASIWTLIYLAIAAAAALFAALDPSGAAAHAARILAAVFGALTILSAAIEVIRRSRPRRKPLRPARSEG